MASPPPNLEATAALLGPTHEAGSQVAPLVDAEETEEAFHASPPISLMARQAMS